MPQRRDVTANRERIVEAARLLWTTGSSPSLEAIAERAGIGIATLYRHFSSRAALETEVFGRVFTEEVAPIVDRARNGDVDLLTTFTAIVEVGGRYASVLQSVGISEATDEAMRELADPFIALLHEGQSAGVIRPDLEVADLFWVMRMMVLGLTSPLSSDSVRERYLALLLPALTDQTTTLPSLGPEDYDRLGVDEHHRRNPT